MKQTFKEGARIIEFILTDNDETVISITDSNGQVTLLTQFYDFDIEYLIKYYQECCNSIDDMKTLFI